MDTTKVKVRRPPYSQSLSLLTVWATLTNAVGQCRYAYIPQHNGIFVSLKSTVVRFGIKLLKPSFVLARLNIREFYGVGILTSLLGRLSKSQ